MNKIDFITEEQSNNVCGYWIVEHNGNSIRCSVCNAILAKEHPAYSDGDAELPTMCGSCGASMY